MTNIVHFTNEIVSLKQAKIIFLPTLFFFSTFDLQGQDTLKFFQSAPEFNQKRFVAAIGVQTVGYGGSLVMLSSAWYKDYDQTPFHFFDDSDEWLQMDKAGHFVTSWYLGRIGTDMMKWSGVKEPKAAWLGFIGGFAYLTGIELMDGFSDGWGFSWSDFGANTLGTGLIIGQNFLRNTNTFSNGIKNTSLKFSFHRTFYWQHRPELLGHIYAENALKDYNGQSYWISFNFSSFMKSEARFPKWLNLSFGYGAEGMTGGKSNPVSPFGSHYVFSRYRQYYLSLDVDLSRIKTKSYFIKTLAKTFCFIKIPAPALEFSKKGIKAHAFYY